MKIKEFVKGNCSANIETATIMDDFNITLIFFFNFEGFISSYRTPFVVEVIS